MKWKLLINFFFFVAGYGASAGGYGGQATNGNGIYVTELMWHLLCVYKILTAGVLQFVLELSA